MLLQELFDYKNQLMKDILTNKEIVRLVNENVSFENADRLAYSQVYPSEYVPDTIEEAKTFICFDVDVTASVNKTILLPVIYVWVFTHRTLLRLPEGGVRTDRICAEIDKAINGSRYYGLGELNLYSVKRFAPMTDYLGKVMMFQAVDFNRLTPTGKPTPSNRRDGHAK